MSALRTPLYDWHIAHRARMIEFGGWEMPVQYTSIVEEHKIVRTQAGLFDISHMGRLSFAGPNALDLIQLVYTNDASKMKDFQVRYGLICNETGGVLDDVLVYRWPYGWAMVVNASNRGKIVNWLNQHKGTFDVQIQDQTLQTVMLAVQGPKAVELCAGMFEVEGSGLKYYYAAATRYKGQNCVISRTGYTGEDGLEIMCSSKMATELANDLLNRGAIPCGLGARDTLRLEAAMPLYGHELTEDIDPLQTGVDWAVKLEKLRFIGRDAMLRTRDMNEPIRAGLELSGKRAAREGCEVYLDNQKIGRVTSGSFAPWIQKSIAMALIKPKYTPIGTQVLVDIRGEKTPATVVDLPFYKRK
jgi:aminomethyltransferase